MGALVIYGVGYSPFSLVSLVRLIARWESASRSGELRRV
jgi:hypothetical protein